MKNLFKKIALLQAFCILIITVFGSCNSQKMIINEDVKMSKFKINVSTSDNEIQMTCTEGCAWKELTFKSDNLNIPQAIDEFGMTDLEKSTYSKDENLAEFIFTIKHSDNKILLKGIKGMAWIDLSYNCDEKLNCQQSIDQFGMASIEK